MKGAILPACFSTLDRGRITLYIKKQYVDKFPDQDIEKLLNLHKDMNQLKILYHGRSPCRGLSINGLNGGGLVVKDYWHGGLFGKILRDFFWQKLRPLNELSICETAIERGINTIEIIAIVKNRVMGPLYKCKLISKEIINTIDLMVLLSHLSENYTLTQKRQIIKGIAMAVRKMHDAGIYHGDLHLKNILVQSKDNKEFSVFIIDLDKSRQFEKIGFNKRMKNIMRLDRSLEKFIMNNRDVYHGGYPFPIDKSDKARFLKEYLRSGAKPIRQNSGVSDEPLRFYLQSYPATTHKLHRLWWRFVRIWKNL